MTESTHNSQPIYIHACGSHSALGGSHTDIHQSLLSGIGKGMATIPFTLSNGLNVNVGRATDKLPDIPPTYPHQQTRNNRFALSALKQIADAVENAKQRYGADRIAVIVGSSTSGIADGEEALLTYLSTGALPEDYSYYQQQLHNLSDFIADYFSVTGPAYVVSTACSSSGRVFLSAKRLLKSGFADAVIVGGADTLCHLTLNGFFGLDSISSGLCQPFGAERDGINIGEAAAFMLLSKDRPDSRESIALLGAGDSSDAHHISAPHPEGNGAEQAMRRALQDAGLSPSDIAYVNAHGTSTPLNDAMESAAIFRIFGDETPVSSTKPLTGHTLGAASAIEASICWHLLHYNLTLPVAKTQGIHDPEIASIRLAKHGEPLGGNAVLSNSFAFGGNNISLIFGKA